MCSGEIFLCTVLKCESRENKKKFFLKEIGMRLRDGYALQS